MEPLDEEPISSSCAPSPLLFIVVFVLCSGNGLRMFSMSTSVYVNIVFYACLDILVIFYIITSLSLSPWLYYISHYSHKNVLYNHEALRVSACFRARCPPCPASAARLALFVPWKQKILKLLCNTFSHTNNSTGTLYWRSLATLLDMFVFYLCIFPLPPPLPRDPRPGPPRAWKLASPARPWRHEYSCAAPGGRGRTFYFFCRNFVLWQKCIPSRSNIFRLFRFNLHIF